MIINDTNKCIIQQKLTTTELPLVYVCMNCFLKETQLAKKRVLILL